VKFSIRQILASAVGAVIAAVIASSFGVKGTIVGVAIGSAAATMATAFVAQSIERGHQAVKQVAVRAPETATLLRKLGGTGASGNAASSQDASAAPTEVVGRPVPAGGAADTVEMASSSASAGETERLEISAVADAPATERLRASTLPAGPGSARPGAPRRFSWGAIAATVGIVFVLALLFITAVELISGKPLADIFGNAGSGTTLNGVFTPSSPSAPPTSTTTSTTTSTSSTTTSTTTSTTVPASSPTTTTSPSASTTTSTTGGVAATTTTTTLLPLP
jgi:cytoskeletal protein RodZ